MGINRKCIHIFGSPLYPPELCRITVPRIYAYAQRIGADVRIVGGKRRFIGYPPTFERFQIYERGWEYEWNACIDADILIGPALPDFTECMKRDHVGVIMLYDAAKAFSLDHRFFARTGKSRAPVQSFIVSSDWTHDVWEPLKGAPEMHLGMVFAPDSIAEYALAYNLAKYDFESAGIFPQGSGVFRACGDAERGITAVEQAKAKVTEWGQV